MWKGVFVIKGWYSGVRRNKRLSTTDNFLTSNAYACIEINARGLINIISSTTLQITAMWKFVQTDKQIRSMSTTFWTHRCLPTEFEIFQVIRKQKEDEAIFKYWKRVQIRIKDDSDLNCQIKFTLPNPVEYESEEESEDEDKDNTDKSTAETLDQEGLSENDKNTTENLLYDLNSLSGLNEDIDLNLKTHANQINNLSETSLFCIVRTKS